MKVSELKPYLHNAGELEVDHVPAIVHDEFARKGSGSYRERAIDRLVEMARSEGVSIYNEQNISLDMIRRYVRVCCPFCSGHPSMERQNNATGDGHGQSQSFRCVECKAEAFLSLEHGRGLSFQAGKKE